MERALDGFRGCAQGKRRFDSQPMVIIYIGYMATSSGESAIGV